MNNTYCLIGNETWDRNVFGGTDISHYNDLYATWNKQGMKDGCKYFKSTTGLFLQYNSEGELWIVSHQLSQDSFTDYGEDGLFAECRVKSALDNCTYDEWVVYGSGTLFVREKYLRIVPGECESDSKAIKCTLFTVYVCILFILFLFV